MLFNKLFFHKKKYGQSICVYFTLGGSTEPPETPLDPPQSVSKRPQIISLLLMLLILVVVVVVVVSKEVEATRTTHIDMWV